MELQLYMDSGTRKMFQERHRFYAEQIRQRVLSQFRNIEQEAQRFADTEYQRLASLPCGEDGGDLGAAAEQAEDAATGFYVLLDDLEKQVTLGALAGMYHQWEKDLRDFLERELQISIIPSIAKEVAWKDPNIERLFDLLEEFGWPLRTQAWFPKLEACRLVVNVYKHGKGRSLDQLAAKHPAYLKSPLYEILPRDRQDPDYQYLTLTEAQFREFDDSIASFWSQFPERLFLPLEKPMSQN